MSRIVLSRTPRSASRGYICSVDANGAQQLMLAGRPGMLGAEPTGILSRPGVYGPAIVGAGVGFLLGFIPFFPGIVISTIAGGVVGGVVGAAESALKPQPAATSPSGQ